MASRELHIVSREFLKSLKRARALAERVNSGALPSNLVTHREDIVELAFLNAFKAWEVFAEEAFLLYMLGKSPPKGRPPFRYAVPPTRSKAIEMLSPERGPAWVDWVSADQIKIRSHRCFRDGKPFYDALACSGHVLKEAVKIRNAIAHPSARARSDFLNLVRSKLTKVPGDVTPGSFLNTIVPRSRPPQRFFDEFCDRLEILAALIVPS